MPRIFTRNSPTNDDDIQIIECLEDPTSPNRASIQTDHDDAINDRVMADEGTNLKDIDQSKLDESDETSLYIVDESSLHESTSIQLDDGESISTELRKSSISSSVNENKSNQQAHKHLSCQAIACKCKKCLHSKSCTICIYLYLVLVLLAGFVGKVIHDILQSPLFSQWVSVTTL